MLKRSKFPHIRFIYGLPYCTVTNPRYEKPQLSNPKAINARGAHIINKRNASLCEVLLALWAAPTCVCTRVCARAHVCVRARTCVLVFVCVCCVRAYVCMCTCVYTYVYMSHTCVCMCVCAWGTSACMRMWRDWRRPSPWCPFSPREGQPPKLSVHLGGLEGRLGRLSRPVPVYAWNN